MIRLAEALSAGLIYSSIPAGGFDDHLALCHREAGRFFAIDILASPHGHDRRQRVPAVAGGNQDGIDIRPFGEKQPQIAIRGTIFVAVLSVDRFFGGISLGFEDIADSDPLDIGLGQHIPQIIGTAAADSNSAHHDAFAGGNSSATSQCRGWNIILHGHRTCRHH